MRELLPLGKHLNHDQIVFNLSLSQAIQPGEKELFGMHHNARGEGDDAEIAKEQKSCDGSRNELPRTLSRFSMAETNICSFDIMLLAAECEEVCDMLLSLLRPLGCDERLTLTKAMTFTK